MIMKCLQLCSLRSKEVDEKLELLRAVLKKLPPENYNNLRYILVNALFIKWHETYNTKTQNFSLPQIPHPVSSMFVRAPGG